MKVNGYQLMQAIERVRKSIPALRKQADNALYSFEGEEATNLEKAVDAFERAEVSLARLQEAQHFYNRNVTVQWEDKEVNLKLAVTLLGPYGRVAKLWRNFAEDEGGRDRWSGRQVTRSKETEYAKRQMSVEECIAKANEADRRRTNLSLLISKANGTEIEIGDDYNDLKDELAA